MQKISESVEGCAGCVHLYQVKASRLGTSSDGPGCRLYGGHAIARCTSFVELKTHRKLYEIQGVSKSEGEGVPSDFVAQLCAELGVEGGERTILAELLSALVSRDFFDDFVIQRELGLRDEEVVVHYDRDTDLVIFTSWVRGKEQTYSVPRKDAIRYKSAGRLWSDAP